MKENISFFLPTRTGSERVINKNIKQFGSYKNGLIELKLLQLMQSKRLSGVILSTNDDFCISIAKKIDPKETKIKVDRRPEHLCLSTTSLEDLINYVPTVCQYDHILWGHVTTPFANSITYDNAIKVYFEQIKNGYDSLVSGLDHQNFFFNKRTGERLYRSANDDRWPRTQDLEKLFEVNHVAFINSKKSYIETKNRIGSNPYLMSMNKIESLDIDWDEDFKMTDIIAKNMKLEL
jgi:CMP-N-acetylneuraminic acid synthetase